MSTGSKSLEQCPLEVDDDGDVVNPHYDGDMFITDINVYQNSENKTQVRLIIGDTAGNEMALDITSSSVNYRGLAMKWADTTTQYVAVHSPLPNINT